MKKIKFQPGDQVYQWSTKLNNAFNKRSIPYDFKSKNNYLKLISLQSKFYSILFLNQKKSYQSRSLFHTHSKKKKNDHAILSFKAELPVDDKQIKEDFTQFITIIIESLERDPNSLYEQATLLEEICEEEEIQIPLISTFDSINSWDEFIDLLCSFHSKKDSDYFELVIALIIQYARLCA